MDPEGQSEKVAKRYDEPIEVTADLDGGAPISFSWRGRRYDVDQQLTSWREAGQWSSPGPYNGRFETQTKERGTTATGVRDREYFRVLARPAGALATGNLDANGFMQRPGAVYDVYRDPAPGVWRLARVWD